MTGQTRVSVLSYFSGARAALIKKVPEWGRMSLQSLRKRVRRSMIKKLPVGVEFFEDFFTGNYYYVDKTMLIAELLQNMGKVNLFTFYYAERC